MLRVRVECSLLEAKSSVRRWLQLVQKEMFPASPDTVIVELVRRAQILGCIFKILPEGLTEGLNVELERKNRSKYDLNF